MGALTIVQKRGISLECRVEGAANEQVAQDFAGDAVDLGLRRTEGIGHLVARLEERW